MALATGTFDVTTAPEPLHEVGSHRGLARVSLAEREGGALDATGIGEMFATTMPAA